MRLVLPGGINFIHSLPPLHKYAFIRQTQPTVLRHPHFNSDVRGSGRSKVHHGREFGFGPPVGPALPTIVSNSVCEPISRTICELTQRFPDAVYCGVAYLVGTPSNPGCMPHSSSLIPFNGWHFGHWARCVAANSQGVGLVVDLSSNPDNPPGFLGPNLVSGPLFSSSHPMSKHQSHGPTENSNAVLPMASSISISRRWVFRLIACHQSQTCNHQFFTRWGWKTIAQSGTRFVPQSP